MLWTHNTWLIFHKISKEVKVDLCQKYNDFFESFKEIIPCSFCRKHFVKQTNGINFYNFIFDNILFELTICFHNDVNKLNKKETWSFEKAHEHYDVLELKKKELEFFIGFYSKRKNEHIIKMLKSFVFIIPIKNIRRQTIYYEYKNPLTIKNFDRWVKDILGLIDKYY